MSVGTTNLTKCAVEQADAIERDHNEGMVGAVCSVAQVVSTGGTEVRLRANVPPEMMAGMLRTALQQIEGGPPVDSGAGEEE